MGQLAKEAPGTVTYLLIHHHHHPNRMNSSCGLNCRLPPQLFHTHHKDRIRLNNHPSNFEALCVNCHREEEGHAHVRTP